MPGILTRSIASVLGEGAPFFASFFGGKKRRKQRRNIQRWARLPSKSTCQEQKTSFVRSIIACYTELHRENTKGHGEMYCGSFPGLGKRGIIVSNKEAEDIPDMATYAWYLAGSYRISTWAKECFVLPAKTGAPSP